MADVQQTADTVNAAEGLQGPQTVVGKLISTIYNNLTNLMALMQRAQGIPDQDKQELGAIIQGFQSFVTNTLGSSGQQQPQQGPQPGRPPVDQETMGKPAIPAGP